MGAQSCQKPKTYFDAGRQRQRRAVGQVQPDPQHVAVRPLPEGDGPRQDRLVHGSRASAALAEQLDQQLRAGQPGAASATTTKAKKPLADAKVEVRAVKGKPGWYEAVAYLRPHFQLETLSTSMRLVAEVPKKT